MSNCKVTNAASKVIVFACLSFLIVALFFTGAFYRVLAGEVPGKQLLKGTKIGNKEIEEKLALAEFNQKFIKRVEAKVEAYRNHELFQRKILEYPAGPKMFAFLQALESAEASGVKTTDLLNSLNLQKNALAKGAATGTITGAVTVEGQPSTGDVLVMAFDTFGFFAGSASTDFSGNYTIGGLPAGDFYVITRSGYVDEFYNNIPLDHLGNWRDADLVDVPEGGTHAGVNFDLQIGAIVTGKIYQADGMTPIANSFVNFDISKATNPAVLFERSSLTGPGGEYEFNIPLTNSFKIKAEVFGFEAEYFNNKPNWLTADPILVKTLNDTIRDVNFSLEQVTPPVVEGGVIEGSVFGPQSTPVDLAFVFAFDMADTSIAGLGISGVNLLDPPSSETGKYQVFGLATGTYKLFANFYIDFLVPLSLSGEYYEDAPTPDLAKPLAITSKTDTWSDINVTLDPGGAIAGNISDETGAALDSLIVVAIRSDKNAHDKFFIDHIDFGLGFSDPAGNYTVPGLSTGDYTLRTVSLLSKHAGMVLDEYYENVQSIFDFSMATPVSVNAPDTTKDKDFVLDLAGAITGHFFEADGITPIDSGEVVIAFNAATGYPELAIPTHHEEDGSYELRPLPTGNFYLLGLVFSEEVIYLPQFYDGKASPETADIVPVNAPNVTSGIDFKMVRAGAIQGIVNLPSGNPVGADSLDGTLVGAFDATTGELMGGAETTFAGGYRIVGLPPGNYKVGALTFVDGFAATYHGGGTSFDDPNSLQVVVAPDDTTRADINLASGNGTISGTVYNADGTVPINRVLVLAYDQTGHTVSAGISGLDLNTESPLPPGQYKIPGLVSGDYYVRTFSMLQIFALIEDLQSADGNGDLFTLLLGLLSSNGDLLGSLGIDLLADVWYQDVVEPVDLAHLDLFSLLFALILSEGDPQAIIPFFDQPPAGAKLVTVSSPGETSGIDFKLPKLADVLVEVEETPGETIPKDFQLSQNFPNPFNPSTKIIYDVPRAAEVKLQVYNLLGQQIRTLFDGKKAAGTYTTQWDGLNDKGEQVAAGVYFLRLETDNLSLTRKMLLVR
ncbi:MAG: FlgD immunoglobulin-like domain containing protein [bacterium]